LAKDTKGHQWAQKAMSSVTQTSRKMKRFGAAYNSLLGIPTMQCAQAMPTNVLTLNLVHEFRSDKVTKAVVLKAKSVLAADESFFSACSPHQRICGTEPFERVARVFVENLLTKESGQNLRLPDAYAIFRGLLRERDLPDIKRSEFKAVVGPLMREKFDCGLRNDLDGAGVRGWKGVRLLSKAEVK
jgi:hypothetical protein